MASVQEIREQFLSNRVFLGWQMLRRTERTEEDVLARLAYELAAAGRHKVFALDLALDMFRASPESKHAMNLSNVIGLLGDEQAADEIWALISGMESYDETVERAKRMKDQIGSFSPADVDAMVAAGEATAVPRPDAVVAVAERVRKSLEE